MTSEEQAKVNAVTAALIGEQIYDNPRTDMREFWKDGRLAHSRPRAGCDGVFFAEWGTYPSPYPSPA